jgi:hypothetical protein
MTNAEKQRRLSEWIDPEERVTVDFQDQIDLNAEVVGSSDEVVELGLETAVPHVRQHVDVPLRLVELSDDPTHYTRDPARPLRRSRLRLRIAMNRPA